MESQAVRGGSWRPSESQQLLLEAALRKGEAARRAWHAWLTQGGAENLDESTARLLPLVYLNLAARGESGTALKRARSAYYYARFHYQYLRLHASRGVRTLAAANIPVIVLKGLALIPLYYHDAGARPMSDVDFVVPTAQAPEALAVLQQAGWKRKHQVSGGAPATHFENSYAQDLIDPSGVRLDLHRNVLYQDVRVEADRDFWASAQPLQLDGETAFALSPADQLLHVCAHGAIWNAVSPTRWVADAMTILRQANLNWDRFLTQTARHELVLAMRVTLGYLIEKFDERIPSTVMDALDQMPVTRAQGWRYQVDSTARDRHHSALKVWYHYDRFQQVSSHYRSEHFGLRFPAYLRDVWDLQKTSQVPGYLARFAWRKLFGAATNQANS